MTEEQRRFNEVCRLMDERLREMSPQERDELMQLHIAGAMTPRQKLKAIADMTDGSYFRATGTEGLEQIYAAIDQLEKTTIEQRRYTRFHELAVQPLGTRYGSVPPLLLIVFVVLALEMLLATTRLGALP